MTALKDNVVLAVRMATTLEPAQLSGAPKRHLLKAQVSVKEKEFAIAANAVAVSITQEPAAFQIKLIEPLKVDLTKNTDDRFVETLLKDEIPM